MLRFPKHEFLARTTICRDVQYGRTSTARKCPSCTTFRDRQITSGAINTCSAAVNTTGIYDYNDAEIRFDIRRCEYVAEGNSCWRDLNFYSVFSTAFHSKGTAEWAMEREWTVALLYTGIVNAIHKTIIQQNIHWKVQHILVVNHWSLKIFPLTPRNMEFFHTTFKN